MAPNLGRSNDGNVWSLAGISPFNSVLVWVGNAVTPEVYLLESRWCISHVEIELKSVSMAAKFSQTMRHLPKRLGVLYADSSSPPRNSGTLSFKARDFNGK